MAKDTALTAEAGAPALDPRVVTMQREIDFSVTNLASGNHFELFDLPAGSQVLAAQLQVTTVDAGGGTLALGKATGTELLTAQATSAKALFAGTNTVGVMFSGDTVDISAGTAAVTTAVVIVTIVVLLGGDFTAQS